MTTAPSGRRRPARLAAGTALLAVAGMIIGLSACDPEPMDPSPPTTSPSATSTGSVSSSPTSTRTPSPSPTPTSSEDAERAAIREAFFEFQSTLNRITTDPSVDIDILRNVAGGELLDLQMGTMKQWRAKGWRATKKVAVENVQIEEVSVKGDVRTALVTYCANSTGVDVVNSDGKSVVVDGRQDYFPRRHWLELGDNGQWLPVRERDGGDACDGK